MNEKDKAKELVERFYPHSYEPTPMADTFVGYKHHAKQCALIACQEVINILFDEGFAMDSKLEYWQNIKTEINNP